MESDLETARVNANIGRRLRELRLERGLQQADAARQLGISPAYLNLIEKGKRTVQLPLLWRALSLFEIEVEPFMASLGERRVEEGLARLLDEPLLKSLEITSHDLAEFSSEPKMAATIAALFNLYKNTRTQLDDLLEKVQREEAKRSHRATDNKGQPAPLGFSPFDEVSSFLGKHKNYFPELELAAERLRRIYKLPRRVLSEQLVDVLKREHKIKVVGEIPRADGSTVVRRFDARRNVLTLSAELLEQPRKFQLAVSIGLRVLDESGLDERLALEFKPRHAETARLIKIHLANYFAGALLLPYEDFHKEVERTRYDIELLGSLFEMSYEAVAHRVCNLSDPRRPGIPFHFLRSDIAGNLSKVYSATGLRVPVASGSCPKWAVHSAFLNPSSITRQYSVMPDRTMYFCFAKVMVQPAQGSVVRGTTYSIGLGTHADAAKHLAYAQDVPLSDPVKMAVPTGSSCRFCERTDCNQRAAQSYKFAFVVDEYTKKDNFFSPLMESEKS
jgi:predicted transcriptional regulator/DNA-binding XRE family transcriptional regulator